MRKLFLMLACCTAFAHAQELELLDTRQLSCYADNNVSIRRMDARATPLALLQKARAAWDTKTCADAEVLYQEALTRLPANAEPVLRMLLQYELMLLENRKHSAPERRARMARWIKESGPFPAAPLAIQILQKEAWQAFYLNELENAEMWSQQVLAMQPALSGGDGKWQDESLQLLAALKLGKHDMQAVERLYRQMHELQPHNPAERELWQMKLTKNAWLKFAEYYPRRDFAGAEEWMKQRLQPMYASIARTEEWLARVTPSPGDTQEERSAKAGVAYQQKFAKEQLLMLRKDAARLRLGWAEFLHGGGELARAQAQYRELLRELDPTLPEMRAQAYSGLGSLLRAQKQFEQAREMQNQAQALWQGALSPDHPDVMQSLGELAFLAQAMGKADQAEGHYRVLLQRASQRLQVLPQEQADWAYGLAQSLAAQKKYEEALEHYQQALKWAGQGENAGRLDRLGAPAQSAPSLTEKQRMARIWQGLAALYESTGKASEKAQALSQLKEWGGAPAGKSGQARVKPAPDKPNAGSN